MTIKDINNFINNHNWIEAKSYSVSAPHEYLCKDYLDKEDYPIFDKVVTFIRRNGISESFWRRSYIYFYLNGYKYWTMGDAVEDTIILNRTKAKHLTMYDEIAVNYDNFFIDEDSLKEDKDLIKLLDVKGKVLDIGCGTGLLLDHKLKDIDRYIGIDISSNMIDIISSKYGNKDNCDFINCKAEDFYGEGFNTIVALFGTASYLNIHTVNNIVNMLADGGVAYFMYYKEGYEPVTYKKAGVSISSHHYAFKKDIDFNNYYIDVYKK